LSYSYITLGQLRAELLNRLQDSGAVFTTAAEANLYIRESLRALSAKTFLFPTDYMLDFNPGDKWKSLTVAGSPRQRTVTDVDLYTQIQAMLVEPMSGGTWTGTNQFNIAMLQTALQSRRDELLLQCAGNVVNLLQPSPVGSMRSSLPDTALSLHRVRWIPSNTSFGSPYALGREDVGTANAFYPSRGTELGEPDSWLITANSPLAFDCSCPPNQPGTWDMLVSEAGATLAPPAATVLGLPDDWCWVAMYGALADVLSSAPEGRDMQRANYCLQVYEHGKKAMQMLPWMLEARVASIAVDTPGVTEMDSQQQNWEQTQNATDPTIVVGGMDLVALAPFVTSGIVSSVLTLVGNAPVPVNDTDEIQLSRDGVDAILARAQHVATFKTGGKDFTLTMPLLEQFELYCRTKNAQYAALGIFRPDLLTAGDKDEVMDRRFEHPITQEKPLTIKGAE
jgi:hypothetical protein